jgi:SNF2 family DNA or RNA helicase
MSDLSYHMESESRNGKNYLAVSIHSALKRKYNPENLLSLASASGEKSALEILIRDQAKLAPPPSFERMLVLPDRSFELMKLLGTTGRVFYKGKKIVIDPFSSFELYFEGERQTPKKAQFFPRWALGERSGPLQECEWVFSADPSWILKEGIVRPVKEEVSGKWVRRAAKGILLLEERELLEFLQEADQEIRIVWKTDPSKAVIDPTPFLVLTDRHGGFADLWFDYGAFGKISSHDPSPSSFRNTEAEKGWEKDLLETDFIKKRVERSHFYCPLDKVFKSLTFLLEIGWPVIDASGKRVLRQQQIELNADIFNQKITVRAKIRYGEHDANLEDLFGAFNRREHFVDLSATEVALIDRQEFSEQWGDLAEQEITDEGISFKKNRFGLLESFLTQEKIPLKEEVRQKIVRMMGRSPLQPTLPGKDFQGELFPYQKEGLQWLKFLDEEGLGGLLADEMGLGKTVQVLAFFSQLEIQRPCLIVVPTSLLFNWQREIQKFLPSQLVYRHEGKERVREGEELRQKQIILTSYALLRQDVDLLQDIDYQIIVLDEAQAIKNPDSQISQICYRLKSRTSLAITGTPIENRLDDLFSIFCFLQPDLLGERGQFQSEVQASQLNAQYLSRMKKKIRPFILRRQKQQVAIELPPKLEQMVFVEMTEPQRLVYERWLKSTKQGLLQKVTLDGASSHRLQILEAILRLRQLCAHPWLVEEKKEEDPAKMSSKFERLMSDLQEVVEEKQKVLVYSQFTSMLRLIQTAIQQQGWKFVYLDGSTKNREEVVRQFQEDKEVAIFLISLKAGGVGLNLTAADYVFLYDPWWNEAVERQAIDRAHRLGKTGTVIARRYITALSIEEKLMRLKEHKKSLSHQWLEMDEGTQVSLSELLDLLS